MEDAARTRPPAVTWAYGLAGLIPFAYCALGAFVTHGVARSFMQLALLVYGALILSFLGGGRWGMEVGRPQVRASIVSGSMAGAVLSTLLVAAWPIWPPWRLLIMALAHVGQWAWDVRSLGVPQWYPRLRHVLTVGAVACLLAGAAASLTP